MGRMVAHSERLSRRLPCVWTVSKSWLTWEPPVSLPPKNPHLSRLGLGLGFGVGVGVGAWMSGRVRSRFEFDAPPLRKSVQPHPYGHALPAVAVGALEGSDAEGDALIPRIN